MATSFPPLPADMASGDAVGILPPGPRPPTGPSATSGMSGLPAPIAAVQQIEAGVQALVQSIPSLAPMGAAIVSQLRQVVPQAMMSGVQGTPGAMSAGAQGPGAGGAMPPPPGSPPPQG